MKYQKLKYNLSNFFEDMYEPEFHKLLSSEEKQYLYESERHRKIFMQEIKTNLSDILSNYYNEKCFSIYLYYESEPGIDEVYDIVTDIHYNIQQESLTVSVESDNHKLNTSIKLNLQQTVDMLLTLTLNNFDSKKEYDAIKVLFNVNKDILLFSYHF
ncbi:hypothetical protein BFS34_008200 [Macrococcoides caseolyticum subsp. hominis]|uniref:hypothetical protein n=1 Tax=Macrococcoides caseolyticum TaxID=69966 RepID=UPI000C15200D|nr:hypothetical protein [Macrococcus caseolyticus]RAI79801.1 hypothetical protein BFS34_008200 [Macrococcus caseolyticus subsp. hominis]